MKMRLMTRQLKIIGHRSYKAFPELDIEYSVQIIEDGDDKE